MANKTWTFELDGKRRVVEIHHKSITGRCTVLLDGKIIEQSPPQLYDTSQEHRFKIDEHDCIIRVKSRYIIFEYDLFLDGKLI